MQLRLEHINPDTRQGEVVALTPSVMLGYFKNPEATKEVFTDDGWFRTAIWASSTRTAGFISRGA